MSLSFYFFLSDFLDLDDESDVEGSLVDVDWGVLVGEEMGVLVGEEVSVLIGEAGGVFVGDVEEDLGGEADKVLEGEASGDGSSSSMIMGMAGGELSTISDSSWLLCQVLVGQIKRPWDFSRMRRIP